MTNRIYLNRDWRFEETFEEHMIQDAMGTDASLVTLPHTCKETPFHYFDESIYQMISCYQRVITPQEEWKNHKILLTFEGVGHKCDVYLNGEHLKEHRCGYTAFTIDISDKLLFDQDNLLTVKVDSNETLAQPPFGFVIDYMTYGGIYRDVYLEVKDNVSILDAFVRPEITGTVNTDGMDAAQIAAVTVAATLSTDITLTAEARQAIENEKLVIRQWINEAVVCEKTINTSEVQSKAMDYDADACMVSIHGQVNDINLWDIESPVLYTIKTEVILEGSIVDTYEVKTGFRRAMFTRDGFFLNGRKVKIRGLNRHQSYAYVGYAMPESMQRMDAKILKKELGANAVRTSHYPQSHYFMDECDKLGLLVFTEIPGWQHIGDEQWKDIAVINVTDMIEQYRNHTSIILWGVRINESQDDDKFYQRTNEAAHKADPTRQTGGVRAHKKSHLYEDVYTYNDFVHSGSNQGCDPKKSVTPDMNKGYLISEYNGHMFPTKAFDDEEHRMEHTIRHANVLDAVKGQEDIAGSFAWCMFDYNTHKDFGSGDRICYHGVMDMFRNPKMAAAVYASQSDETDVLELSSSMDIGEHPACNRGDTYIFSNADSVRMYKNQVLLKEYYPKDSQYQNLSHGPILIDDYVGNEMIRQEGYSQRQGELVRYCLNSVALNGMKITPKLLWAALRLVLVYHMNPNSAVALYNKYVGDWGGASKSYRFDAIRNGAVVSTIVKAPMTNVVLSAKVSHNVLQEKDTYDVAEIRLQATDENDNLLHYYQEPVHIAVEGPLEVIGPKEVVFRGGMTGIYVKTIGESGTAHITLSSEGTSPMTLEFTVKC